MALIPFVKNDLWGFVDEDFQLKIQPRFEQVGEFSCGWCPVKLSTGKWNYVNESDQLLRPIGSFYKVSEFKNGFALIGQESTRSAYPDSSYIIDLNGNSLLRKDSIFRLNNNYWITFDGHSPRGSDNYYYKMEMYDSQLNFIFDYPLKYFSLNDRIIFSDFENGIVKVGIKDETCFIDESGKLRLKINVPIQNISKNINGVYSFIQETSSGVINLNGGKIIFENTQKHTQEFPYFLKPLGSHVIAE